MSEGFEARVLALSAVTPQEWGSDFPGIDGIVLIYDGSTWPTHAEMDTFARVGATRPVVVARVRRSKYHWPPTQGLFPVSVFEESDFSPRSHHQSKPDDLHGFSLISVLLRNDQALARPTDQRRRGYAFLSYASPDRVQVYDSLVPALYACGVGFFDYRYTELLADPDRDPETKLAESIREHIEDCAVVIVLGTPRWNDSKFTRFETHVAVALKRPILAVVPPGEAFDLAPPHAHCPFSDDVHENSSRLAAGIAKAVGIAIPSALPSS